MMADLLETYYQLKAAGQFEDVGFFTSIGLLLSDTLTGAAKVAYEATFDVSIEGQEVANVEKMWEEYTQQSLDLSHRVLLVSHSQGNLFANRIYKDYVLPSGYGKYFANLQIATPARKVEAELGRYVTLSIDPVINPIPKSLEPNAHGSPGHSFIAAYLQQPDPVSKILNGIGILLDGLDAAPSQWRVSGSDTVCLNGKMVVMENHLNTSLPNLEDVYFEREGKLQPDGSLYLFGTCTAFEDKEEAVEEVVAQDGFITVGLNWSDTEVDMDLEFDTGYKDMDDIEGVAQEHYVVAAESDINIGYYGIYVTHDGADGDSPQCLDEVPLTLFLNVKTPDGGQMFAVDIKSETDLDLGHVAGLYVEESGTSVSLIETETDVDSNGTSSAHRPTLLTPIKTAAGLSGPIKRYELIPHLQQALFGPLGGASVRVDDAFEANASKTLYTGTTTYGGSSITTGLLALPQQLIVSLEDDSLYLFEVSGGEDIDADDDLSIDVEPTLNHGRSHAILSGAQVKVGGFKVNILTEIAYQACSHLLDENSTVLKVQSCMKEVAFKLLRKDVDGDGKIGDTDLVAWTPYFDKSKLKVDYKKKLLPIVNKIYQDNAIDLDVQRLLLGSLVVEKSVYDEEQGVFAMTFDTEIDERVLERLEIKLRDSEESDINGTISYDGMSVFFMPDERLIDDGRSYQLHMELRLEDGSQVLNEQLLAKTLVVPDKTAPLFTNASLVTLDENTREITLLDAFDRSGEVNITISGGNDSTSFGIDEEKRLFFRDSPDFEIPTDSDKDNQYEVIIQAMDMAGNSCRLAMQIKVLNVFETLNLERTVLYLDENIPVGSQVGTVNIVSSGEGAPSYEIEGDVLRVDSEGRLFLERALSYEYPYALPDFELIAYIKNTQWDQSEVRIKLNDVVESLPEIWSLTISVAENTSDDEIIGSMSLYSGVDDEVIVRLAGDGAEDFDVDPQGNIRLSPGRKVDHLTRPVYHLIAVAINSSGSSIPAELTIYVDTWLHQFDMGEDQNVEVLVNAHENVYIVGETRGQDMKLTSIVKKYDRYGKEMWTRQYGAIEIHHVNSAVNSHDGGLYVLGTMMGVRTHPGGGDFENIFLLRYSDKGALLWKREFDSGGSDIAISIAIDQAGGLYLLGRTNGSMSGAEKLGGDDAFLMHLDAEGHELWTRQYGGSSNDDPAVLKIDSKGDTLFVVYVDGHDRLYNVSSDGTLVWSKVIGLADDKIVDIEVDITDAIYATGNTYVYKEGYSYLRSRQALLVKYNNLGERLWRKTLGSGSDEFSESISLSKYGGAVIAGRTSGDLESSFYQDTGHDVFLSYFDADGERLWTRQYGTRMHDDTARTAVGPDGHAYLTGKTLGSLDGSPDSRQDSDIFIIKTDIRP